MSQKLAPVSVVIGASSDIAQALIKKLMGLEPECSIVAITRQSAGQLVMANNIDYLRSDYSESSIDGCVEKIATRNQVIKRVVICNGILHSDTVWPEKSLSDFKLSNIEEVLRVNAVTPALWIARLAPLLKSNEVCHLAVFSARIGSITDNRLGGWYSYRSAKAALNMFLKTAAIELWRRSKNVKLIAFHPGTTDTPLSKPFQKNVPDDKLFSPGFVAEQLLSLMDKLKPDGELSFKDWNHQSIDW